VGFVNNNKYPFPFDGRKAERRMALLQIGAVLEQKTFVCRPQTDGHFLGTPKIQNTKEKNE
jgi:hypothetical protein